MQRVKKGEFGYISYRRKVVFIRTAVFFALCAAIFLIGYITVGTRKNLLTVVAILGCLPASKSLVNAIMFARAKGCSEEAHQRIEGTDLSELKDHAAFAYDLYMTSYDRNFPVSHITVYKNMVTGLAEGLDNDMQNACAKHIEEHLKTDGFKDLTVKIYSDADKYADRLVKLSSLEASGGHDNTSVLNTLTAISL